MIPNPSRVSALSGFQRNDRNAKVLRGYNAMVSVPYEARLTETYPHVSKTMLIYVGF